MVNIVEGNNVINVQMTPKTGNLSGTVTSAATGLALANVKVSIDSTVSNTNAQGQYAFTGLPPGTYTVTFELSGYNTETR